MAARSKNADTGAQVEIPGKNITTDELAALGSFDDALKLVTDKLGTENLGVAAAEIGDGFKLLDNKDQLCGIPFIAVTWDFHNGEHGEFASVKVMTKDGLKFIINDGSTGIRDQLMQYTAKKNTMGGLLCEKGLRRSNYEYQNDEGQKKAAVTYYLDTSA